MGKLMDYEEKTIFSTLVDKTLQHQQEFYLLIDQYEWDLQTKSYWQTEFGIPFDFSSTREELWAFPLETQEVRES